MLTAPALARVSAEVTHSLLFWRLRPYWPLPYLLAYVSNTLWGTFPYESLSRFWRLFMKLGANDAISKSQHSLLDAEYYSFM